MSEEETDAARDTRTKVSMVTGYEITVGTTSDNPAWKVSSKTRADYMIGPSGNLTVCWESRDGSQHARSFQLGQWLTVSRRMLSKALDS